MKYRTLTFAELPDPLPEGAEIAYAGDTGFAVVIPMDAPQDVHDLLDATAQISIAKIGGGTVKIQPIDPPGDPAPSLKLVWNEWAGEYDPDTLAPVNVIEHVILNDDGTLADSEPQE